MANLKISKKHHKHLNNPFPANPKSLGFIHGRLISDPNIPHAQNFKIGDFLLNWSSRNGGSLSVFHKSEPSRSIWSTIPGEAFVSAGFAETQVEESRGSFFISDNGFCFCNHQTVEDIGLIHQSEIDEAIKSSSFQNGDLKLGPNPHFSEKSEDAQDLVLLITGWIYNGKEFVEQEFGGPKFEDPFYRKRGLKRDRRLIVASRYWFFLDQKTSHQLGFHVKLGKCNVQFCPGTFSSISRNLQSLWRKVGRFRRRFFRRVYLPRGFAQVSSKEEKKEKVKISEFNRVFITYSSEEDEKFYGFGEQFSHMEFKGKRVPIFVQEQGIGRGDQPITLAANLISYR